MIKIKKIRARSIRGLPQGFPDILVGSKGVLVFGPNGSGKSSIVDTIEAAVGRDPIPFRNSGLGVTWAAGRKHIRYENPVTELVVDRSGTEYVISPEIQCDHQPDEIASWQEAAKGAMFVLRRSMLLNFIEEQPRDRYLRIEPLLDLVKYGEFENEFRSIVTEIERARNGFQQERRRVLGGLKELLGTDDSKSPSDDDIINAVNPLLTSCNLQEVDDIQKFEDALEEASNILKGNELADRVSALSRVKIDLLELKQIRLRKDIDTHINNLEHVHSIDRWEWKVRLTVLLEQGKVLFEDQFQNSCPLCENDVDRLEVLDRVARRLEEASVIREAQDKLNASHSKLLSSFEAANRTVTKLLSEFETLSDLDAPDWLHSCSEHLNGVSWQQSGLAITVDSLAFMRNRWPYDDMIDSLAKLVDDTASAYGGNNLLLSLGKLTGALKYTLSEREHLIDLDEKIKYAVISEDRCRRTYQFAEQSRKQAVREIFESIKATANDFYGLIHPGEEIANSDLEIREGTAGSVKLTANFHGKTCDPRLYLSESHQDTLGLCYFLALRRFEVSQNDEFKVLVLDDVLHSVDSDHRARIVSLLIEGFSDHQLIITTHDSVWYEYLKAQGKNFTKVNFTGWSIDHGPTSSEFPGLLEIVLDRDSRIGLSEQVICFAVGVVMEMICKNVAYRLEFSTPFNPKPTLGPLWNAVSSKIHGCASYSTLHSSVVEAIRSDIWFRNRIGGHHNEDPAPITHAQAMTLADNVSAFYDSVFCADCRRYVIRQENGHWTCPCGTIRYER